MTQTLSTRPLTTEQFHAAVHALNPKIAVFDCDGTLWSGDAGSGFMTWTVETGLVSREAADWIDARYRAYHRNEVSEIAICGEMGGDPVYALVLMALGFDELSMTAGQIPAVKQIIRRSSRTEAAALLEQAMSLTTAEEIERYIRTEMERRFSMDGE